MKILKRLIVISVALFIPTYILAQEHSKIEYSIETKNLIYNDVEQTFIFLTISNLTDKEIEHKGYGFTAESFSAKDQNGKILHDSEWLGILRLSKRYENPIKVPAIGKKTVMYRLEQLFVPTKVDYLTLNSYLSDKLELTIKDPKF